MSRLLLTADVDARLHDSLRLRRVALPGASAGENRFGNPAEVHAATAALLMKSAAT